MPKAVGVNCPHCNAPQEGSASPAGIGVCPFCGHKYSLVQTVSPFVAPPRREPAPPQHQASPPMPATSAARRALVIVVAFVLLGGAFGAYFWLRVSKQRSPYRPRTSVTIPRVTIPRFAVAPAPEEKLSAEFTYHNTVRATYGTTQYVYGLVKNTSRVALDKPKIIVVLRDGAGRELDTRSAYAERELNPGESCPVSIMITNPPAYASHAFETSLRKYYGDIHRADGLRLETRPGERNSIGSTIFKGKVHNDGKTAARFVRVLVTALDGAGKIVGVGYGYAEGERLLPGTAARYEVHAHFSGAPAKYELSVEGRPIE